MLCLMSNAIPRPGTALAAGVQFANILFVLYIIHEALLVILVESRELEGI